MKVALLEVTIGKIEEGFCTFYEGFNERTVTG